MPSTNPPHPTKPPQLSFDASLLVRLHTVFASLAFGSALVLGCTLHYKRIVKNSVAGWPDEWWPSVSATIGDWYPERNVFQIFIALASGPRFALVFLQYLIHRSLKPSLKLPTFLFLTGIARTLSCGGWVYITSSDDHDVHDVAMIGYMLLNIPWMGGVVGLTPKGALKKKRTMVSLLFLVSIIPLVYFFIQHKVQHIPGAYTKYSLLEWSLIVYDVWFDSLCELELRQTDLKITVGAGGAVAQEAGEDRSRGNGSAVKGSEKKSVVAASNGVDKKPAEDDERPTKSTSSAQRPSRPASSSLRSWFTKPRPTISYISDIYLSYVFWTIQTALLPSLFYFSIWELGFSGFELAILVLLSPILVSLLPSSFAQWLQGTDGQCSATHMEIMALGMGWWTDSSRVRLAWVTWGALWGALGFVGGFVEAVQGGNAAVREKATVHALGFVVSSLSRMVGYSNNPLWPQMTHENGGLNIPLLGLALISLFELYNRPSVVANPSQSQPQQYSYSYLNHLPLTSLLTLAHNLLSSPYTLPTWSWSGYQNSQPKGPIPGESGWAVILALCTGIALSSFTKVSRTKVWYLGGLGSGWALLTQEGWYAFGGALGLATWAGSVWASAFELAVLGRPSRTRVRFATSDSEADGKQREEDEVADTARRLGVAFFHAFGTYILLIVLSVFTVAYAFVPGGWAVRERTDIILACQGLLFAPLFFSPNHHVTASSIVRQYRTLLVPSLLFLSLTSVLIPQISSFTHTQSIAPFKPPHTRIFTAGIWTLHFGYDNRGRDSQVLVDKVLTDLEVDVVGLLESDLHRPVFGNRDMTRYLAEKRGYYVDLGPAPQKHTWGAALLSKFPIVNSTHHLLPSPHGELAPAIEAVLDIFGELVTVIVSHNGQEEDALDRELQSRELGRIMKKAGEDGRKVVFLGYVVSRVGAERPAPYKFLVEDGDIWDIDKEDGDRWCEYILYRGLYRTSYARISRGIVTDTELQLGQFVVPKHGHVLGETEESKEGRYRRSYKEELGVDHWMPMQFYQSHGGVNGHYYHVFGTPLYYKLPEGAIV